MIEETFLSTVEETLLCIASLIKRGDNIFRHIAPAMEVFDRRFCLNDEVVVTNVFSDNRFHVIVSKIDHSFFENATFIETLKEALPERATLIFNTDCEPQIDGFYRCPDFKQVRFGWTFFKVRYDVYSANNQVESTTSNFRASSLDSLYEIASRFNLKSASLDDVYVIGYTSEIDDEEIPIFDDSVLLSSVYKRNFVLILANISHFDELK